MNHWIILLTRQSKNSQGITLSDSYDLFGYDNIKTLTFLAQVDT